jgi:hypothetical protein
MRCSTLRVTERCMGYKKASVIFGVPHTALDNKVKCANNNPNHEPNVPLEIKEDLNFAPFVRTVLPHIWGKTGRFTLFFYSAIFHVKIFFFLQYKMSLVTLTVKGQNTSLNIPFYLVPYKAV